MGPLAGCTPFGEFLIRNCLERPIPLRSGIFRLGDMLIHYYPYEESELSADVLAQLEQCHNTDRFAITKEMLARVS